MEIEEILEGTYQSGPFPNICSSFESDVVEPDRGLELFVFLDEDSDHHPNVTGMVDMILYAASLLQRRSDGAIELDEDGLMLERRLAAAEKAIAWVRERYIQPTLATGTDIG